MARKTEWRIGPDGLDARVTGHWVHRKVHHVDRLTAIFGTGMSKKWSRRGYVELFSGPGLSYDRTARSFVTGSALRALKANFTDYVFVDLDPRATAALEARVASAAIRPKIIVGDCNSVIPDVRAALPRHALSLAFVDPTNWQVRFDAIANLVDDRRIDLLFTFHVAAMRRVGAKATPIRAVDAFFGTPTWRDAMRLPRHDRSRALVQLYNRQLGGLGYLETPFETAVPVKNRVGRTMYLLILFSRDPLGLKFWREAMAVNELGQRTLWDKVPPS